MKHDKVSDIVHARDMRTDSIERIVPDDLARNEATGDGTLRLHVERYQFAASHISGARVLDIACGAGYGTFMLAESSASQVVIGVDADADAIAYARSRYSHPKVRFDVGDARTYRTDAGFDTIVTLETIEHLSDPEHFVTHLATLLKPGGRIIASTPVTPSVDANPHHISDFTPRSFRKLFLALGFREISSIEQTQQFAPLRIILRQEKRAGAIRSNLSRYYFLHPDAMLRRIISTIRYGFTNRYATIVWHRPGSKVSLPAARA